MDRSALLAALIRHEQPLDRVVMALADLPPDTTPAATLTRMDISAILDRYVLGELSAADVSRWAALVECREDIEFEPRHEEVIADALYDLSNPDILPLADILDDVRFLLGV